MTRSSPSKALIRRARTLVRTAARQQDTLVRGITLMTFRNRFGITEEMASALMQELEVECPVRGNADKTRFFVQDQA